MLCFIVWWRVISSRKNLSHPTETTRRQSINSLWKSSICLVYFSWLVGCLGIVLSSQWHSTYASYNICWMYVDACADVLCLTVRLTEFFCVTGWRSAGWCSARCVPSPTHPAMSPGWWNSSASQPQMKVSISLSLSVSVYTPAELNSSPTFFNSLGKFIVSWFW